MSKTIGEREKFFRAREDEHSKWLPREDYHVIRVDGRAFHTFTRGMKRPFDVDFMANMDACARALCREVQGVVFAYVQSDEISLLVPPAAAPAAQLWFGGQLRKWLSVSAAVASARMTVGAGRMAQFDSRVLSLCSRQDVVRYFLWRQGDCARNAIQATAQHHVGHKKILGKDRVLQLRALEAAGVDYNALPQGWRQGRVVMPELREEEVSFTHKKTGEVSTVQAVRTWWVSREAPWFDWDEKGFLEAMIP